MIIVYHLHPVTGSLGFDYGHSMNSQQIQDFINHEDVPSYKTLEVDAGDKEFMSDDALKEIAKNLWEEFGNIPTSDGGVDGDIEEPFLHFDVGTDVYSIWAWFESTFHVSIAEDLIYTG